MKSLSTILWRNYRQDARWFTLLFFVCLTYYGTILSLAPAVVGPDGEGFIKLGKTLYHHHRFAMGEHEPLCFHRVPVYPWFIAGCLALPGSASDLHKIVFGQVVAVAVASVAIAAITCMMGYRRWAFLAGLLFAVYRGTIFSTALVTRETVAASLFYPAILFLLAASRTTSLSPHFAGLSGIAFGGAALCREEIAAYAIISLIFLITTMRSSGSADLRKLIACFILGNGLIFMPWIIRNYVQSRHFLPLSTAGATEFYAGNNPNVAAQGIDYSLATRLRDTSTLDSFETASYYQKQALEFILSQPAEAGRNNWIKLKNYLVPPSQDPDLTLVLLCLGLAGYLVGSSKDMTKIALAINLPLLLVLGLILFLSMFWPVALLLASTAYRDLLIVGLLGMGLALWRHPGKNWLLPVIYLLGIIVAALIIPQYRQRFVLDGILCIYAVAVLDFLAERTSQRKNNAHHQSGSL